ncbi:winged helix-turn-helix domain-containing protein [Microbulbifer yueqingensis]|nr:winged helix-turn-helix domain-containing protein [Microbulbifer yueqingensis]
MGPAALHSIGEFEFDIRTGTLSRGQDSSRLEPQVSAFLGLLIEHAGVTVSRDTITRAIWPDRVVSDDALRAMVKKLREALGDDARNPRYLRTLPLKGYVLIAEVAPARAANRARRWPLLIIGAAATAATAMVPLWLLPHNTAEPTHTGVERLTRVPGSEVSADYNPATKRLVFSHRSSKDDHLQLFVKDGASGRVQRLTWDSADYANAHWSPTGDRLVYTRSQGKELQHYLAGYHPERGIIDARPFPPTDGQRRYLQSWSRDGSSVYLKDAPRPGAPRGIWRLALDTGSLQQITAPNVDGAGDYVARESLDGRRLALLRGIEEGKRELLILDLATGTLLHTRLLPQPVERLAWHPDGVSIALSGFNGSLLEYHLAEDRFVKRELPDRFINDVFFQCGDNCFFMRRHNGNFLDLEEQPDPFADSPLMSADRFDLDGAEDFPQYAAGGRRLFYFSLGREQLVLQRRDTQQRGVTLASLPVDSQVTALQASPDGKLLAGIVDQRLFILDAGGGELRFLTSGIELPASPAWSPDGSSLLYAKRERGNQVIYRYLPAQDRHERLLDGYSALRFLPDGRAIAIDEHNRAWVMDQHLRPYSTDALGSVASASTNRWQVKGNWLYFSEHRGNDAFIVRISLNDRTREERLLAHNRFRLHFHLHPREDRLIGVKSMLAESDLVRVGLGPVEG